MRASHKHRLDNERLLQIVASHLGLSQIMSAAWIHKGTGKTTRSWDQLVAKGLPVASIKSRLKEHGYIEVKVWLRPEDYIIYDGKRYRKKCDHHVNVSPYGEILQGKARGRKRSNVNPKYVYCNLDHQWYLAAKRLSDHVKIKSANKLYKRGIQQLVCRGLLRVHLKDTRIHIVPVEDGWMIVRGNGTPLVDLTETNETDAWIRAYSELVPKVSFFTIGIPKKHEDAV